MLGACLQQHAHKLEASIQDCQIECSDSNLHTTTY